jgi:hypothetical protein
MNTQPSWDQHLRLSDAERDQAAAALGEHYAQGRLTTEEHSERLDRIWAARTRGELPPVFRDLPGAAPPRPRVVAGAPARRRRRGVPTPLLVLLVVLVAFTVLTNLPLILIGLGVWFLLARGGACSTRRPRQRGF